MSQASIPAGFPVADLLFHDFASAAACMAEGGLAVYPTETFFGIGCRADRADAVLRIFEAKRRKADMPLPVILGSAEQLELVAAPSPAITAAGAVRTPRFSFMVFHLDDQRSGNREGIQLSCSRSRSASKISSSSVW